MVHKFILVFLLCGLGFTSFEQVSNIHNLMPVPAKLSANGHQVKINAGFSIAVTGKADPRIYLEASRFVRRLSNKTGIFLDKIGYVTPKRIATDLPLCSLMFFARAN